MKQFTRLYNALGMLAMLCLASCASDELNDRLLPAGEYPMSFTTVVEGQVSTRVTTDNTWSGDEQVALVIDDEVKEYAASDDGSLTSDNPFYWQKSKETKTVRAWYCGEKYLPELPSSLTVKTDQSSDGYKKSDFLYALPQKIEFNDRKKSLLTFKHLPAKVVVHLKNGDGVTADEVTDATVRIVNQATTSGNINAIDGTVEQTSFGGEEIIPNSLATTENYQQSMQALVVPQQMQGKKFIKVTIGKDADACNYYYIPKTDTDANLENGKQYIYNIIVKKTGLEVTVKTLVSWVDMPIINGSIQKATFNVTCPSNNVRNFKLTNYVEKIGDKYTVNDNEITISYKPNSISHRYHLEQGIAYVSTSLAGDGTVTLSISVRGDLVFSFAERVEVGDYYYSDGTWSNLFYDQKKCIGIVFKTGVGEGDNASNYGKASIHGYVAALKNASSSTLAWSTENVATGVSTRLDTFDGYSNTKIIRNIAGFQSKYPAVWSCVNNNGIAAPQSSSGWYLPSCAQIMTFHNVSNSISTNFTIAGGEILPRGDYWSSNEYAENRAGSAWHYSTYYPGFYNDHPKTRSNSELVRAILTF